MSMANTAGALCAGDCGGDRMVTVNELITGVNIALGAAGAGQCPSVDGNGDGAVVVNELVAAVANALNGCPFLGQYGARIDVGDGETALIRLQVAADGTATGTLSVGPTTSARGAALRIDIPFLNLTGTVDLDSGAYHLTGTVPSSEGDVPVDVSGVLPERPGLEGTLQLEIGPDMFSGPIRTGNGDPTPTATATRPAASPTPTFTPTAMPADYPTPGETCQNASFSLVFHDPVGVNSYVDLGQGLSIGKGTLTLVPGAAFGGGAVPCTVNLGDVIRRVQLIYLGPVSTGASIPLGRARGQATFDYLEMPVSNPLGTRGWRADSGTLVIDHLDATSARVHIANAVMSPEPSFSAQQPATGTFIVDAGAAGTLTQAQ
jgi:hypothetical protein